jgi:hypothetical protein
MMSAFGAFHCRTSAVSSLFICKHCAPHDVAQYVSMFVTAASSAAQQRLLGPQHFLSVHAGDKEATLHPVRAIAL